MHKEIEVVNGDGSNLNISAVGDHIANLRPKSPEKKQIVIPTPIKNQDNIKKKKKKSKSPRKI